MPAPSGGTLALVSQGSHANSGYALFRLSGTYVAANFSVTPADGLGFSPAKVNVQNLTDRISMEITAGATSGLLTVAAGTRTFVAHGATIDDRKVTIAVATNSLVTDNDTVLIECWG